MFTPLRSIGKPILFALMFAAGPAAAQGAGAAAAETLFDQGRAAMEKSDYVTACKRFRESDHLDPAPGTKLNLADCEEQRGHVATAWELFRAALQDLPDGDERSPMAKQRAAELEKRLPKLTMRLAADAPSSTTVKDGDVELGSGVFGIALPLDPGRHTLVVSAPGRAPKSFRVDLVEGRVTEIEVSPASESEAPPPESAPDVQPTTSTSHAAPPAGVSADSAPPAGGHKTLGYVLGGIGAAGLVVGGITGIMLLGKKSTASDHCSTELRVCDQEGIDANDAGRALAPVSTIGFIVGIAGIGAGAYFILSGGEKSETALRTSIGPGAGELTVVRRW